MFNRSEIIVLRNKLTNKQTETPLKTSTSLRHAMPVGKYSSKVLAVKAVNTEAVSS